MALGWVLLAAHNRHARGTGRRLKPIHAVFEFRGSRQLSVEHMTCRVVHLGRFRSATKGVLMGVLDSVLCEQGSKGFKVEVRGVSGVGL